MGFFQGNSEASPTRQQDAPDQDGSNIHHTVTYVPNQMHPAITLYSPMFGESLARAPPRPEVEPGLDAPHSHRGSLMAPKSLLGRFNEMSLSAGAVAQMHHAETESLLWTDALLSSDPAEDRPSRSSSTRSREDSLSHRLPVFESLRGSDAHDCE
jgi:hypothetical protein